MVRTIFAMNYPARLEKTMVVINSHMVNVVFMNMIGCI